MKMLYLIRHTQPDIASGTCYGRLDIGVADSFAEEAQNVLQHLPPVELVIASPLLRTRLLAEHLVREQGCELRSDARLLEKHFGDWEGKAWDDIPRNEINAWAADVMDYAPPGGESGQQVMQRMQDFLLDLAQLSQHDIALVAHGGSIRAMLALVADVPLAETFVWDVGFGAVIGVRMA